MSYGQSDNCSPATTYNTLCTGVAGTNTGATTGPEDSYAAADICALSVENTVWYTFTAPIADTYTITMTVGACAPFGSGLQTGILTGPCGGPYTSLNCGFMAASATSSYTFVAAAGQQVWIVIDGDGGDECPFTMDICGTACNADAGTVSVLVDGVPSASPVYLCSGGTNCVDLVSNNDFVLPTAQPGELSELMYALYTCLPTTADPGTDPCYSGSLWSGQDFADCNPSTYGLTGTFYFVPITADDSDNGGDPNGVIHYDQNGDGCFDLGTPIEITYLTDIAGVATPDCNNGSVDIVLTGGAPEFGGGNYTVTNTGSGALSGLPVTHSGTLSITGLTNGDSYSISVTGAGGCSSVVVSGTFNAAVITNVAAVDPTCGLNNGSITITGTGTSGALQYSIDNGVTFQGSNAFTGLAAGTYDVVIEDAAGCQATQQVTLNTTPAVSITNVATTDPTCGNSNGTITITAGGGTAPLTYSIDNGVTFQAGSGFTGLAPGTYDIVVEDAVGCQATTQVTITDQPGATITNIATVDPTCGNTNGSITITASGGTAPLQYSIDNGVTFQAGNNFTGLGAGTYDVVVEDANGCQTTQQVTLNNAGAPTITNVVTVDANCNGATDGTITISATGGTAPLQYSIDNGVTFQAGNAFTGLGAGTYDIVVEDALGCQATTQVVIGEPVALTVVISETTTPTCDGSCDGLYLATPAGGTAPYSYLWGDGTTNPTCPAQCDGVTIDVTITDANGCVATDNFLIADILPITYTATVAEDTCSQSVGEIVITASGGDGGPYTYSNDNGTTSQASNTFSGLSAGNYDIVITDANGCTGTGLEVVTDLAGPSITNVATVDPTCGASNGSITITASGGTAPLQYSIDNGVTFQASNTFTGLGAGSYDIVVEDASGCQVTQTVALSNATGPSITNIATVDVLCNGDLTGEITITATGGTAPLQYSIDNGVTFQAGNAFTGLAAGTYDVVLEDAAGCQATQQVTINEPAALTVTITETLAPTCDGSCDGEYTATVAGGTPPYTYVWFNGVSTPSITGICDGASLNVTITDANGCTATDAFTVTDILPVTYAAVITDENCGAGDGTMTLTAAGGDGGPYTYSIDNGVTFQASGAFNSLPAGVFNIVIEDASGCQVTATETVSAIGGPNIDAVLITDPSCAGLCDGMAVVQVSGGTQPYTFQWFDGSGVAIAGATNDTLTGICGGNYSVEVNDASGGGGGGQFWNEDFGTGCDQNNLASSYVSANGAWAVNSAVGANDPFANEFYVSATEAGMGTGNCGDGCLGTPALNNRTLHVGNVAGSPASLLCPTGDCGAAYDATVTTNRRAESPFINATGQSTITVSFDYMYFGEAGDDEASLWYFDGTTWAPLVNPLPQTACCGGPCTGLLAQGQWTNFSTILPASANNNPAIRVGMQWTNSNNNSGADPSFAVDDIVLSTPGGGVSCPALSSLTLTDPPAVAYTASIVDETCSTLGSIDLTGSGGDGGPYTYSIDNGVTFQASGSFPNLPGGTYNIVVQDASGCTITGTEVVASPGAGPTISSQSFNDPLCNGDTGNVAVTATGVLPLQFSIDGGTTFQAGGTFGNLPAGVYEVIIEDANGCQDTAFFTLTDPALLVLNPIVIDETCVGNNGSIDGNASGGTGALQYSINGGALQASGSFTGLIGGTYTILAEDANGCQATTTVTVNSGAGPTLVGTTAIDPLCGGSDGSIDINVIGNGPFDYSIDNGLTFQTSSTFTGLSAGLYDLVITDVDGCATTAQVTLVSGSAPVANCAATPTTGQAPLSVDFGNTSTGATSFFWDFDDGNTSTDSIPNHIFTADGTYNVILVASNGNPACNDTCSVTIVVFGESSITVPNIFSPNNDGINDVFRVVSTGIDEMNGIILNRWGQKVYEWNGPGGAWDGRTAPGGQETPEGTYYYIITAVGLDGKMYEEKGAVTLVRK